jgi:hypothetical protein
MERFLDLYSIVRRKKCDCPKGIVCYNVSFRRTLIGDKLNQWHQLLNEALKNSLGNHCYECHLYSPEDRILEYIYVNKEKNVQITS